MTAFEWHRILRPEILVFAIPIVAIMTVGIVKIASLLIKHRERMALIEQGLHPDDLPKDDAEQQHGGDER